MILNIPHSGTVIPPEYLNLFKIGPKKLAAEIKLMTDHETFRLFRAAAGASNVISTRISRLLVDMERFEDDDNEPMAKHGMGVIYRKTSDGRKLKKCSPEVRKKLLTEFYYPYHRELSDAVAKEIGYYGFSVIIDCHSFPSRPLHYEDSSLDRPDLCFGVDSFHTPPMLVKKMVSVAQENGLTVAINQPFSGTIVPSWFYRKDNRVKSVMIEVNRAGYMDEQKGVFSQRRAEKVAKILRRIVGPAKNEKYLGLQR